MEQLFEDDARRREAEEIRIIILEAKVRQLAAWPVIPQCIEQWDSRGHIASSAKLRLVILSRQSMRRPCRSLLRIAASSLICSAAAQQLRRGSA